ncbi:G-type lectin S-receptor-like serine/threonine-protein kinase At1g34300 [Typha angustifolia]|uniref:G-type lectin S-receptor-like serine/threonine-protein kinase At1g34300 n=1 Tax=Typha angustifolia TaxID=59011 RepID=UPI003C2EF7F7
MASSNSDSVSGGDVAIAIVSVITIGAMIIAVTYFIYKCVKQFRSKRNNASINTNINNSTAINDVSTLITESWDTEAGTVNRFIEDILKEKPMRFTPQNLKDFTSNYAEKLGSGGFGVVYKGKFPSGVQVAVKILNGTLDKRAEEQFMAEVGTVGRTNHINLVRLYGFCFESTMKALVYEYMVNGSLDRYLFNTNYEIKFEKLYEIAVGTAKGIRYLHEECEHKIVHYDIKPGNVLLTPNFSAKVADFGLAKLCDRANSQLTITGARGTPGYAAPEMWMPMPVTDKCDVYSFGMLLFEILGRRRNLELDKQPASQEWYPRWVWQKMEQGLIGPILLQSGIAEIDREKAERMCKVALWCVQYQAEGRPPISSVVRMLEGDEEIISPIDPFAYLASFSPASYSSSSTGDSSSQALISGSKLAA